jgi:hypothetical protein
MRRTAWCWLFQVLVVVQIVLAVNPISRSSGSSSNGDTVAGSCAFPVSMNRQERYAGMDGRHSSNLVLRTTTITMLFQPAQWLQMISVSTGSCRYCNLYHMMKMTKVPNQSVSNKDDIDCSGSNKTNTKRNSNNRTTESETSTTIGNFYYYHVGSIYSTRHHRRPIPAFDRCNGGANHCTHIANCVACCACRPSSILV